MNEFGRLQKKALFTSASLLLSLRENLEFILLNVRSLKRHVINIDYDKKLIENEILFLTETQGSHAEDLSTMLSMLE